MQVSLLLAKDKKLRERFTIFYSLGGVIMTTDSSVHGPTLVPEDSIVSKPNQLINYPTTQLKISFLHIPAKTIHQTKPPNLKKGKIINVNLDPRRIPGNPLPPLPLPPAQVPLPGVRYTNVLGSLREEAQTLRPVQRTNRRYHFCEAQRTTVVAGDAE